jgi:hypothetical protein
LIGLVSKKEGDKKEMTKEISEAGTHYKQLMEILKKNSSYPEASILSHKRLCSEWIVIQSAYDVDAGLKCLCGKENIYWHHVIRNRFNDAMLDPIGSSCVKRFGIELLGITCMCCAKPLTETNPFLQAYMNHSPITKETLIVGHKRCAKKLFINAKMFGRYGDYLAKEFVSYFKTLGVKVSLDKYANIDMEYDDTTLTPYIDLLGDSL